MRKIVVCFPDELRAAASLLAAANAFPGETSLWVPGGLGTFPLTETGADKLVEVIAPDETVFSEPLICAQTLCKLFGEDLPGLVITLSSPRGDALAAQFSLLLDGACVLAAKALFVQDGAAVVRRSVCAGNLDADFAVHAAVLCVSLLPGRDISPERKTPERTLLSVVPSLPDWLSDIEFVSTKRSGALADAACIIAAGRGAGKQATLEKLKTLAKTLGASLGASRPLICEGKLPPELQIGLSGIRASPKLCLVFGASGAAAFRAGITDSKKIAAVNRDPEAPIFKDCDIGIIADCGEFATSLEAALLRP